MGVGLTFLRHKIPLLSALQNTQGFYDQVQTPRPGTLLAWHVYSLAFILPTLFNSTISTHTLGTTWPDHHCPCTQDSLCPNALHCLFAQLVPQALPDPGQALSCWDADVTSPGDSLDGLPTGVPLCLWISFARYTVNFSRAKTVCHLCSSLAPRVMPGTQQMLREYPRSDLKGE